MPGGGWGNAFRLAAAAPGGHNLGLGEATDDRFRDHLMLDRVAEYSLILPDFAWGDLARFVVWVGVAVVVPGHTLRRAAGLRPGDPFERWALSGVLGVLAGSLCYFGLAAMDLQAWHGPTMLGLALAAVAIQLFTLARSVISSGAMGGLSALVKRQEAPWSFGKGGQAAHGARSFATRKRRHARLGPAERVAVALIGLMAVGHVVQVARLVRADASGVRLVGAMFSDKMTNMSPAAALRDGVPPAALRFSGRVFPSHYFPHLFVASADLAVGVDYVDGFWFHAAALGIVLQSLAVAAFCRRFVRSRRLGCAALVLFGLVRFTTECKPLDLSLALLLLGIVALDRRAAAGRKRWAVLAAGLLAAMPFYEVFTAAAALGGLAVWAGLSVVGAWRRRAARGPNAWRDVRWRVLVAAGACLGTVLAVRMLYFGAHVVASPELIARNSYRQSYNDEWRELLKTSDASHRALRELYRWKRNKPPEGVDGPGADAARPSWWQRAGGQVVYNVGFAVYFLARFVNLALFGVVAVVKAIRGGGPSRAGWTLAACVAAVGFGVPAVVSWGHWAGGRWYETPNIYRLTECGYFVLLLAGVPMLLTAIRQWRRARWWIPLALAGWQVGVALLGQVRPATQFHHVDADRLSTLLYLRENVPHGEVVLHPWMDDLIRDAERPAEVAWVYKRHFTLGSNLAGCQMFYEGREDHLFINGFVTPEEVLARRALRDAFYASPGPEVIERVVEPGRVRWIVADAAHPAPKAIQRAWRPVHASGAVRVYRRPSDSGRAGSSEPR